MDSSDNLANADVNVTRLGQAVQDRLIAQNLPGWVRQANVRQLGALGLALGESLELRHQVDALLKRIEPLDRFVASRLETALQQRYQATFDVRRWRFLRGIAQPVINAQPVGAHLNEWHYKDIPLLEAALRNFTLDETRPGTQAPGNRLTHPRAGKVKPPSASEFAGLCRELDLGAEYQRHLEAVWQATKAGREGTWLLAQSSRQDMLVEAYQGRLMGRLTEQELTLIVELCREGKPGLLDGDRVVAKQLSLLGCPLERIVVLDVIEQGVLRGSTRRVLLNVPEDPHGAWSAFPSLRQAANELGRRLRSKVYQAFFARFVRRRHRQAFYSVTTELEALTIWANLDLKEHMSAYPLPLFESLARSGIAKIKDDAAMIATPVAKLDAALQREQDERLLAGGGWLVGLAGVFVPEVGAFLLATTAVALLKEIFLGVEAWHEGDDSLALDHVMNVARDLLTIGATTVALGAASRAWTRSTQVDACAPAHLHDGGVKLWNHDLQPFRSTTLPPAAVRDEQGVYRFEQSTWVEMDGHFYAVHATADGQWCLSPRQGHAPVLVHNAAGAWRVWSEQPTQWEQVHRMFRRFGGRFRALDDEQIDQLLLIHGIDGDDLRGLHVRGVAPDAELVDSVMRVRLDKRIRTMVAHLRAGEPVDDLVVLQHARRLAGATELSDQDLAERAWAARRQLLQQLYESAQASDTPGSRALRRVFPSLHPYAAQALVEQASAVDREHLIARGRVTLRLAEMARARSLRVRAIRVYEALHFDMPQNADLARVALGMLEHLPGAASGVRWRLFEGYSNGPLLFGTAQGMTAFDLVHVRGRFILLDAQGQVQGEAGELFEVMARAYRIDQRDAMRIHDPFDHNLRVLVARQAMDRRERTWRLLGTDRSGIQLHMPLRQAGGRLGYPLGGHRPHQATQGLVPWTLNMELRRVYPAYTEAQIADWALDMQRAGRDLVVELRVLHEQLRGLQRALSEWVDAAPRRTRSDRRAVRERLLACWQRVSNDGLPLTAQASEARLVLSNFRPGHLPELPERSFAHVIELSLIDMDLERVPGSFLRGFTRLQTLQIANNRLARLPPGLAQMSQLRELDLYSNHIVLDAGQAMELSGCTQLECINLSYNPLGRTFSLVGFERLNRLLMRHTQVGQLPSGLLDCQELTFADLSDNPIARLPEAFFRAPLWLRHRVSLAGNPLTQTDAQALRADAQALDRQNAHARQWSDAAQASHRDTLLQTWCMLEAMPGSQGVMGLLRRLLGTEEFQSRPRALATRVFKLLQSLRADAALREELFAHADDALTCQDSALWRFINFEVRVMAARARAQTTGVDQQNALLRLGRQLWRLAEVEVRVRRYIQALEAVRTPVDPVEVKLGYYLALRGPLDLPIEESEMAYPWSSRIDPSQVERIRTGVLAAEDQEVLTDWMVDQTYWQEYLAQTHRQAFDTLNAPHHEGVAALFARLEAERARQDLPANERQRRVEQIEAQINRAHDIQKADERYLRRRLTSEAMEAASGQTAIDVR
ncbi:hypothetical protein K8374_10435 [Pseudomonas sp. p1(2021b)]|uniref:NEL-type E3 ubiquitin ligase domain-containing protein n=1 Tax=Pseudomonas sp. p1(2021b) TaxID=2874628 RepID=UPI001CC91FCE|nr:NEL-type E3 ubiquitin ligase domain-containing protein [Pseudomonas sp. p1(2021b)]UBM27336.1 hypothetical protein K8374_10435 [Pseudomonas sp. p1(2021b)]